MLTIDFDETIESSLPPDQLWYLITDAFEDPKGSPIWPIQLEAVDVERLREGAHVRGSYQIGSLAVEAAYRITSLEPGRAFSYESEPTHPLEGGATVTVEPRQARASALRWSGHYEPRRYLTGIPAVLYVRLAFLPTFFSRLENKLRAFEARWESERARTESPLEPPRSAGEAASEPRP